MSRSVQAQADVGTLSLQGLGAFTSILSTLSADNVAPMALIQMERLGAAFPINGEYAERVKTLLQRCCDVRLNRLALSVGWRKNDTASLMADSTGGQAIALLSMCITNLLIHETVGAFFSRLCSKLLANSTNVASVSQLADVAKILTGKLDSMGFGNLLAREVTKIHQVYAALGDDSPVDLLETLTLDSMLELMEFLS